MFGEYHGPANDGMKELLLSVAVDQDGSLVSFLKDERWSNPVTLR